MRDGEGCPGSQNRRPDFDHGAKAGKGPDEPEGYKEIERHKNGGGGAGERQQVDAGDAVQRNDGNAHGSEGDGRSVGEQGQPGSLKRSKAEADEDRRADGDWRSETRSPLKERAQGESDEEQLQAAVGGDAGQALLQRDEAAGLAGEVIEEDDGKNDPANGEDAVTGSIGRGGEGQSHRHVEDDDRGEQRSRKAGDRRNVGFEPQNGHGAEEHDDGQGGDQRGELPVPGRVVALHPAARGGVGLEEVDRADDQGEERRGLDGEREGMG